MGGGKGVAVDPVTTSATMSDAANVSIAEEALEKSSESSQPMTRLRQAMAKRRCASIVCQLLSISACGKKSKRRNQYSPLDSKERWKWYSVLRRYGFISRNDGEKDVFVHQTAISKSNTEKFYLRTLGDEEEVLFDLVKGKMGQKLRMLLAPKEPTSYRHKLLSRFRTNRKPRHSVDGDVSEQKADSQPKDSTATAEDKKKPKKQRKNRTRKPKAELKEMVTLPIHLQSPTPQIPTPLLALRIRSRAPRSSTKRPHSPKSTVVVLPWVMLDLELSRSMPKFKVNCPYFESNTCDALLTAEVYLLLEHRRVSNETKDEIEEMSEVFIKTLNYARRMSRFKNRETIRAVRAVFSEKHLHKFEVAQIANLCPENAEEAKALVPSLENKIEESELEEVLKDLQSKRTFQ
uniref:CSD_1 domain-containing protein n=1 Tax=Caenorhabditis tropicalis TaxID=1561998 RepID=A0A1I7U5U7_9PELO